MASLFIRALQRVLPQTLWLNLRQRPIIEQHERVARYWQPLIAKWQEGRLLHYELCPKKDLPRDKVIWQYWGQGIAEGSLPEVVKLCFASVDRYRGEYQVIRLSDDTIGEYLDVPEFVWEKLRGNDAFTRTFFSDLLRLMLLHTYGGVWLDATVLLSGELPREYLEMDFFAFQRDDAERDKALWRSTYYSYYGWGRGYRVRLLNSILFAKKGSRIIDAMLDLLLYYWEHEEDILDYFFFQILFYELVQEGPLRAENCPIISDCLPHVVQKKLSSPGYSRYSFSEILTKLHLHKMSYYDQATLRHLKDILRKELPELSPSILS